MSKTTNFVDFCFGLCLLMMSLLMGTAISIVWLGYPDLTSDTPDPPEIPPIKVIIEHSEAPPQKVEIDFDADFNAVLTHSHECSCCECH